MSHWLRTLDISDDWKKASDGKISLDGKFNGRKVCWIKTL